MRGPIPDKPATRPTVTDIRPLVEAFWRKPGNGTGGCLHAILDDGNLEDWCILHSLQSDRATDPDARIILEALLAMTRTQRRKLYKTIHVY